MWNYMFVGKRDYLTRFQTLLNGMVKTKLAILPILCCEEIVKNSIDREDSSDEETAAVAFMYGEKIPREKQKTTRAKSAPSSRLSSLPGSIYSTPFSSRPSTARSLKVNPVEIIRRPQTSLSAVSRNPSRYKDATFWENIW